MRIQEIWPGGGGGGGGFKAQLPENSPDYVFFTVFQRVSNSYFEENYNLQGFRGGPTFSTRLGCPNVNFYRNLNL